MSEVYPIIAGRLYQSGSGLSPTQLHSYGAVLNLIDSKDPVAPNQKYRQWPIEDGPLPSQKGLDTAVDWVIQQIRAGRKVLVHCYAGVNRSALVNALVVKRLMGLSGKGAVQYIRSHREGALTNPVFAKYIETGKRA